MYRSDRQNKLQGIEDVCCALICMPTFKIIELIYFKFHECYIFATLCSCMHVVEFVLTVIRKQ